MINFQVSRGWTCDNLERGHQAIWFIFRIGRFQVEWVLSIRQEEG